MKIKTLGRIEAAARTAIFGYAYNYSYNLYSSIDYQKASEFFLGDSPLETKLGLGAFLTGYTIGMSLIPLFIMDSLTDLIHGTHHYFGVEIIRRMEKNPDQREKINNEMGEMLETIEKPLPKLEDFS